MWRVDLRGSTKAPNSPVLLRVVEPEILLRPMAGAASQQVWASRGKPAGWEVFGSLLRALRVATEGKVFLSSFSCISLTD